MEKSPANLYFNNVISMGISYSWTRQNDSAGFSQCDGLNHGENNFVKRSKSLNLDVLNLDLNNAGGSSIADMAKLQNQYVVTDSTRIYANGLFAGKGKLSDFSINEGSLSNESITNLTYEVSTEDESFDQEDDPVTRNEEITVSRDVKNKSYSIDHSYSISYGDDFDFVSDHPLYKDDPNYSSVEGRLALGENEANLALYTNPVDYGQYVDLSSYSTEKGWNLAILENGCSGVFSSSSSTKDYINGDYSLSKRIELRYTGEDLNAEQDLYELNYSMSWSEETRNNSTYPCAIVKMEGTVIGVGKNCSSGLNPSIYAESGYNLFITEGEAKQRVVDFFNYIRQNVDNVPSGAIHDTMFDLRKNECNPSVEREGTKNNGEIKFSFEMNNCPNYDITNSSNVQSSTNTNISYSNCNDSEIKVIENSAEITVSAGDCFSPINSQGEYVKYNSITDSINKVSIQAKLPAYVGEFPDRYKIRSETNSESPYKGEKSYSVSYSDAPGDGDCGSYSIGCNSFNTKLKQKAERPRYLESNADCTQVEKGKIPASRSVSTSINIPNTGCDAQTLATLASKVKSELLSNKPTCVIQSISWNVSKSSDGSMKGNGSINGIDS